ncbi:TetR/AcrR family transcriptional regulator [Micromonospora sp. CA-263727]|uniref:TetR/AcrR family transcriptional regulator n=1 Tax=Micromonospora sp. CA-263727 TaxID=3239967 RepID=UPI003D9247AC
MPTAKGLATRERILGAAVDVLIRSGREAMNLDDILAVTKTSKSQLFHYFPGGKRELIHEATHRQVQRIATGLTGPLDSLDAWRAWVEQTIHLHRTQTQEDACEVAALAARVLDPEPGDRAMLSDTMQTWKRHFADGIRALQANGEIRDDADADAIATLFSAVLQGGAVLDKATGELSFLEPALRVALAHLESFARAVDDAE